MSYQSSNFANPVYFQQISHLNPLSKQEEVKLSNEIKKGGKRKKAAASKLVLHNVKLVVKIAQSYTGMGLDMDDLISEGNIGLHEASLRYDSDKGAKFSSYSSWWIRQRIRKALTTKSRNVRVPHSSLEKFNEVVAFINSFEESNGYKPDLNDIAKGLKSTTKRIDSVINAALGTLSLDADATPDGDDSDSLSSVYTLIEDEGVELPKDSLLRKEEKNIINKAMKEGHLTARERKIIKGRFGFEGKRQTLEKLGERLKITRERVRQIETVALFKIKNYIESKDYKK